jgi:hypothetical protein
VLVALATAGSAEAKDLAVKQPRAGSTVAGKTGDTAKATRHSRCRTRKGASHRSKAAKGASHRSKAGCRRHRRSRASTAGAPTVSWKAPIAGQTVRGLLTGSTCEAKASDTDMYQVRFSLDGKEIRVEANAPYNCVWDTTKSAEGATLEHAAVRQYILPHSGRFTAVARGLRDRRPLAMGGRVPGRPRPRVDRDLAAYRR